MSPTITIDLNQPRPVVARQVLLDATWAFFSLAVIFTSIRIFIRIHVFRKLMLDDYFVLLALALLLGNSIVTTIMIPVMYNLLEVSLGLKKPGAQFLPKTEIYMKTQMANTLLFWTCLWTVKAGFLTFFRRLTKGLNKWFVGSWWAIVVITILTYISTVSTYFLACSSWNPVNCDDAWHVHNSIVSFRYTTAVDIITDAMIMSLPLALSWRCKVPRSQKLALGGVFSLGFLVMLFSILRIIIANHSGAHPEITWLALWSNIECSVAVIVISLISFRAFFVHRKNSAAMEYYSTDPGSSTTDGTSPRGRNSGFRQLASAHDKAPDTGVVQLETIEAQTQARFNASAPLADTESQRGRSMATYNPTRAVDASTTTSDMSEHYGPGPTLAAYNPTRPLDATSSVNESQSDDQERAVAAFNATRPLESSAMESSDDEAPSWPFQRA